MSNALPRPLISRRAPALQGNAKVPGDKSVSHRSLMFGAMALGRTTVTGLLEGEDVLRTAAAMRALGAEVTRHDDGSWELHGRGIGGLGEPADVLDMGNAGTGVRLVMGLVASHPFATTFTGDASLRSRPMRRVTEPLSRMGASFFGRSGGRLPMTVIGTGDPLPIAYELPVASAQVKSAILLAGLNTPGTVTVIEQQATRDHTERMLTGFGAEVKVELLGNGGRAVSLKGQPELRGQAVIVPADPSSAAFPAVAALLVPGSAVVLPAVGINPLRAGLYETLKEMGADLTFRDARDQAGEAVADLVLRHGPLKGVDVPPERAPSMIDEYPILAVAAAFAQGTTRMRGLAELRVKESDRLAAVAKGLQACGVALEVEGDDLIVHGTGKPPKGGASIAVNLDHRIAMAFLVMGMASEEPVTVDDAAAIETSFPGFADLMNGLGAKIAEVEG
jgi:3-phosphoshikimate 1-carboxyvinyltransferase